jgi:hypothetical protein
MTEKQGDDVFTSGEAIEFPGGKPYRGTTTDD